MAKQQRSEVILAAVLRALKAKRDREAVRLLVEGLKPGTVPVGADITNWLSKSLGRTGAQRLVRALSFYPCFYCKQGVQRCGDCRGRGTSNVGSVCGSCVGLGMSRCDFCDAAGWATYSFVPCGLRQPVILQRVQAAVKELEDRLARPIPKGATTDGERSYKAMGQELLALNRLAGVFENAEDAARRLVRSHPETSGTAEKVRRTCHAAWRRIEPRMRETLQAMGRFHVGRAKRGKGDDSAEADRKRASFYERLSQSKGFNNTCLAHPFLMRLAKQQADGRGAKARKDSAAMRHR